LRRKAVKETREVTRRYLRASGVDKLAGKRIATTTFVGVELRETD